MVIWKGSLGRQQPTMVFYHLLNGMMLQAYPFYFKKWWCILIFLYPKTWGWMIQFDYPLKWVGSTPIPILPKASWEGIHHDWFYLGRDVRPRILLAWSNGRRLQGVYIVWQIQILDAAGDDRRWSDFVFFGGSETKQHPLNERNQMGKSIPSCSMFFEYVPTFTIDYINLRNFQCSGLIYKWLFQLDDEAKLYRMGNGCLSEIHLKNCLFEVPGVHEFISRETILRLGTLGAKFRWVKQWNNTIIQYRSV